MSDSLAIQDLVGFAVEPITNCPHIPTYKINEKGPDLYHKPCQSCSETNENWQCLHCKSVYCSRYCQGHMKKHVQDVPEHSVCISYSDLSVWCYICGNYIIHKVRLFYLFIERGLLTVSARIWSPLKEYYTYRNLDKNHINK